MAGGARDSGGDDSISEINVTPFVDVTLVLLIIFMIAAPVVYQSGVRVQLPKATSAEKIDHVTLRFFVTADGQIKLGSEDIADLKSLEPKILKALNSDPLSDAIVAADKDARHGQVLALVDLVREMGIKQVAIAADPSGKK